MNGEEREKDEKAGYGEGEEVEWVGQNAWETSEVAHAHSSADSRVVSEAKCAD